MAIYAVGDIQGCYDSLRCLLDKVSFDPAEDTLWVAGDMVNRGPQSLKTLRYIKSLKRAATVVLGNHDLHLLAVARGVQTKKRKDTFGDILAASDCEELMDWMRHQKLVVHDKARKVAMAHAGIPHIWSLKQAKIYAKEVETVLSGDACNEYLQAMYGNEPQRWQESLAGLERLRVITNYFTRMRFADEHGALDFNCKQGPLDGPQGYKPWYAFARSGRSKILFGHWAALEGRVSNPQMIGLDTGCVWGAKLTLVNLDSWVKSSCDCRHDQREQKVEL